MARSVRLFRNQAYPALELGSLRGGISIEPDSLPAIAPQPTTAVEIT